MKVSGEMGEVIRGLVLILIIFEKREIISLYETFARISRF